MLKPGSWRKIRDIEPPAVELRPSQPAVVLQTVNGVNLARPIARPNGKAAWTVSDCAKWLRT